jgi:uncharacterized protein involved in response to NO
MLLPNSSEPTAVPARLALWELGFRPFYLLASGFAAISIPLWALQYSGLLVQPYLAGPVWHAHEMLFGFALAAIVGFLFTAARNWTNQPTPSGFALAALAGLWIAGRILVMTPFAWTAAAVDVAFPLAAALALAIPFIKVGNRRNYFFVLLLILMAIASAFVHLAKLGIAGTPSWLGLQLGLDVLLFIVSVMSGRVIPMFTNNGVHGAAATRNPWVEKTALGLVLALAVADMAGLKGVPLAVVAFAACIAHGIRWILWQPWKVSRTPLVWVLHLAYAWIPVHLVLRALAEFGWVSSSSATHALTVGAVGGLIIGMMTRTTRGHTARPLRADQYDVFCYLLVLLGGAARVMLPILAPEQTLAAILGSAVLWSGGFGLFLVRYWPALTRGRLDGKPG